MNNSAIKVSIICLTFNHEKYISQCLEGFVMQKTNFPFEVIVHDDASTDNTPNIIKNYQEKYPNIIKPILQKVNQHSVHIPIKKTYIFPRVNSKYIALCEGDDFWCSPDKLQKQYDILEQHPECMLCVHRVSLVKENGEPIHDSIPNTTLKTSIINSKQFFHLYCLYDYIFQTSCYFMRADSYKSFYINPPQYLIKCKVGDVPTLLYYTSISNIYYIDEVMSCYRRFSIGSWTKKIKDSDIQRQIDIHENRIEILKMYDVETNYQFHDEINNKIALIKIMIFLLKDKIKECLSPEVRNGFMLLPVKRRICLRFRCYFPFLYSIMHRIIYNILYKK